MKRPAATRAVLLPILLIASIGMRAQKDPGPRSGAPGAGGPYLTLNASELSLFSHAFLRFARPVSVSGNIEKGKGLGPTFNGNACAMCHAQPTAGGSSPGLTAPEEPRPNPQVALATLHGATNSVPSFITAHGPVLVPRFVRKPDGTLDGDVHGMYTIAGRTDAKGCTLKQPDFARQIADNNVALRIPAPLYGLGLVENTPDAALRANLASTEAARSKLGIGGAFNVSPNNYTIARFGWKAQDQSLLMFAAEAASVEEGISNELFPDKRDAVPGCIFNATPEDSTSILNPNPQSPNFGTPPGTASEMSSDIVNFAAFIRLLAQPKPAPPTSSTENGEALFNQIGCALCHSPTLKTAVSIYPVMSEVTYRPFSDFALHHMGVRLADGIYQGAAGPDEFRTAPLWGVGQRLFFLHDGRTSDLLQAIEDHRSGANCNAPIGGAPLQPGCNSEADTVIRNFKELRPSQIQDILNFLRSL
jgi:cytochrome c551/c552